MEHIFPLKLFFQDLFWKNPKQNNGTDNGSHHLAQPAIGFQTYQTEQPSSYQTANQSQKQVGETTAALSFVDAAGYITSQNTADNSCNP